MKTDSSARDHAPNTSAVRPSAHPEGWNGLDVLPHSGEPVDGLLASGEIVHAEWWGPCPPEMFKPGEWDGSGWGFEGSGLADFGRDAELIAWRPWSGAR